MSWELTIRNVAGIREGSAELVPGVNAVRGSNWRGKSSFIRAIATAMGTDRSLTEGEANGEVTLDTGDRTVTVTLTRRDGAVVAEGEPFLTDESDRACAELFAFFDERNEVRRAVRRGGDLEALLTRPLDLEDIDDRIAQFKDERTQVEAELERVETAATKLPSVEEEVTRLEAKLDELRSERATLEPAGGASLSDQHDQLGDVRAEREQIKRLVDQLEATIEETREKLEERHQELKALEVPEDTDIEAELETVRAELAGAERDAEVLQSVYAANKQLLDGDRLHLLADVEPGLLGDTVTCWTCGRDAERERLDDRLEELGETVMAHREAASELRERQERLQDRRDQVARKRRRKEDLEAEIRGLESTLRDREESLVSAESRLGELEDRAATLAESVDEIDDRLTEVASEIKLASAQLEDLRDERRTLETQADQRELLEDELEELTSEIEWLRNRKDEMKEQLRAAFDEAMQDVVARFDTGFETARLTPQFDLVVARDGRRAPIDALSEGEVELLSIVVLLAGQAAFDVAERVPVMLLDGIGGLAAENLQTLVDSLGERVPYLVFTAYPEHGSFGGHEIEPDGWRVVSADIDADARP